MIIQELVPLGSLHSYLIENANQIKPNVELKIWASQIASGKYCLLVVNYSAYKVNERLHIISQLRFRHALFGDASFRASWFGRTQHFACLYTPGENLRFWIVASAVRQQQLLSGIARWQMADQMVRTGKLQFRYILACERCVVVRCDPVGDVFVWQSTVRRYARRRRYTNHREGRTIVTAGTVPGKCLQDHLQLLEL